MSDIVIQPANLTDFRMNKITPSYLVSLNTGKKHTENQFVAVKFDNLPTCGKFVGFFFNGNLEELYSKYDEIIKTTDPLNFVEILFPWDKIVSVRSLVYKHKGEKK